MLEQILHVVLPVFAVAAIGWLFAFYRKIDLASITDVVLYLSCPALIFSGLLEKPLAGESMLKIGGGAIFIAFFCGAATFAVLRITGRKMPALYLPAMFPNTGNLGLPIALFAFGQAGLAAGIIVFTAITLVHYSVGIAILSKGSGLREMLRQPIVYAAAAGVAAVLTGYSPPAPALRTIKLLGEAAVPLMLLSLGYRLHSVKMHAIFWPILAVLLRMLPGLFAALLWTRIFGMSGVERGILLITGVLPSAVMNFVLAEKYKQDSEVVASAILIGTVASFVALPLVMRYLF